MAIRLREVEGTLIALCAVETDEMPGDVYLDDGQHYALSAKFWRDYQGETINFTSEEDDRLAETQKIRDAKEEAGKWVQNNPTPERQADQSRYMIKDGGDTCFFFIEDTKTGRIVGKSDNRPTLEAECWKLNTEDGKGLNPVDAGRESE